MVFMRDKPFVISAAHEPAASSLRPLNNKAPA
jgi:hypothetical protein